MACAALDVSVAQFVSDAARHRLESGQGLPAALQASGARGIGSLDADTAGARADSEDTISGSSTVWEQGRLARARATQLRDAPALRC
jgi:hypothetical protein